MSEPVGLPASNVELAEFVGQFYASPLDFVISCYPWQEPGPLEHQTGPDQWQREHLTWIGQQVAEHGFDGLNAVAPLRSTVSSGHGIGKSVEVAWIVDWIMSTRPHCRGTITANTFTQLQTKTWASIRHWTRLCITGHWFEINSTQMYHPAFKGASWYCTLQSSEEKNSESFAGQHAADSTSFYIFDEASGIGDKIFEVAEGGLTDGEPMIFMFGNPTRNTGKFYRATFGADVARWQATVVDSRQSKFTNKTQIAQWIQDYGEDSDFVRVRVKGLPPHASELQYIDKGRVALARARTQIALPDDPLVAGFDVSGGGKAWNVIRFRRGLDGRARAPIRLPGEGDPDRSQRIGICAELLRDQRPGHQLAALFIDSAFGAAIAVRLRALGFEHVYEVNFGGTSPDAHQLNMRAYMWAKAKDWLLLGSLPDEDKLCEDLCLPGYHLNQSGKLVLESKADIQARGEQSPDDGDAFCLTFAQPVAIQTAQAKPAYRPRSSWG